MTPWDRWQAGEMVKRLTPRGDDEARLVDALVHDLQRPSLADVLATYLDRAIDQGTDDEIRALRGVQQRIQKWETGQ